MSELTKSGGPGQHLAPRLHALERAVDASRGMMPAAVVDRAAGVRTNAHDRLARGDAAVVVALAGGTGSGKSTLFNPLADSDVAEVGVRRPTTTDPVSMIVGDVAGADTLLDWLEVHKRFAPEGELGLDPGLVLLALPDHDSIRTDHKATVDRLVRRVDALLWVLDPQKYAQGILHRGYLRDLRQHAEVQLIALNKVDQLVASERDACVAGPAPDPGERGARQGADLCDLGHRGDRAGQAAQGAVRAGRPAYRSHPTASTVICARPPMTWPPTWGCRRRSLWTLIRWSRSWPAPPRVDDRAAAEGQRYATMARRATRPPLLRAVTSLVGRRDAAATFTPEDFDPQARGPSRRWRCSTRCRT